MKIVPENENYSSEISVPTHTFEEVIIMNL